MMRRAALLLAALLWLAPCTLALAEDAIQVSDGPLKDARSALAAQLMQAQDKGVGIGGYKQAFSALDLAVTSGATDTAIKQQLDRIQNALNEQLHKPAARGTSSTSNASPTAPSAPKYFVPAEALMAKKLGPVAGLQKAARFQISIQPDGKITDVKPDASARVNDGETTAIKSALAERIAKISLPPTADGKPLTAYVFISNDPSKFELTSDAFDFGPYMADLQRRIKKHWFPPKGNEDKLITVRFNVNRDGVMSNLQLAKPSAVELANKAALSAVQDGAPFRPLPDGAPKSIGIDFTFDYKVWNGFGRHLRQF